MGFSPKHPQPPAYIKVRSRFKKEREFDRLFLAQELRSGTDKRAPPPNGSNPSPQSGSAATHNPIWATEFSRDGKHLAAGGQDRVVRVWAVISSPEERRTHENEESRPNGSGGEGTRLSAPVFQQKPIREYHGHTSTILDLSWSKVSNSCSSPCDTAIETNLPRIISSSRLQWIRPSVYGTSQGLRTCARSNIPISFPPLCSTRVMTVSSLLDLSTQNSDYGAFRTRALPSGTSYLT